MTLSDREKRLLVMLAIVAVLAAAFLVLRGRGSDVAAPGGPTPTTSISPARPAPVLPTTSPTFVVPPDVRDPFSDAGP